MYSLRTLPPAGSCWCCTKIKLGVMRQPAHSAKWNAGGVKVAL